MKQIDREDKRERSFFETKQAREIIILRKMSLKSEHNSIEIEKKHIVKFIDFFFIENDCNNFYLVMELCDVFNLNSNFHIRNLNLK